MGALKPAGSWAETYRELGGLSPNPSPRREGGQSYYCFYKKYGTTPNAYQ